VCTVTPDGHRVVSASNDGMLKMWDLESGRVLTTFKGHKAEIGECLVTPDGHRIISASWDKTLRVWDLGNNRRSVTLKGHADWVTACAITPDGCRVVSGSKDGILKVWDLESGRELATTVEGDVDWVTACAVSPDGSHVVSASVNGTLNVWDLDSGHVFALPEGHDHVINACAVTPDGRSIISASSDRTLKIWNLVTGQCLATVHGLCPFHNVAAVGDFVAAIDQARNLWILESTPPTLAPTSTSMTTPIKLFYSYAHKDEPLRDELETHLSNLKRQGLIASWHDRDIPAGSEWAGDIDENLEKADVILLLVSANFIASNYCFEKEMKRALERHEAKQAVVIPIILKPCDWTGVPFGKLQGLPKDAKAVTTWPNQDEAWTDVAKGIRRAVEGIRARRRRRGGATRPKRARR
jgi:hypothetical protein